MADQPEKHEKLAEAMSKTEDVSQGTKTPKDIFGQPKQEFDSKEQRILWWMRKNVEASANYWDDVYDNSRADIQFAYTEQWEPEALIERQNEARPVVSPNIIPQYINRITGAMRQTKFSIHVQQVGGPSAVGETHTGAEIPFSEVMEGLIRDIEAKSYAHNAYCRAGQHAVEGGIGWLRAKLVKSALDPFNNEIRIEHVRDRYSVIVDHLATESNLQDANYAYICKMMNMDDFNALYPEKRLKNNVTKYDTNRFGRYRTWYQDNAIMVGEYYWKEPRKKKMLQLVHMETDEEYILDAKEAEPILDELRLLGYAKVREKEVMSHDVMMALVSHDHLLEGPFVWPGSTIPIVPVVGRQVDTNEMTDYQSLYRYAKDSQVMFNYMCSSAIERVANASKAQWLATATSIAGLDDIWQNQHVNSKNVLVYNESELGDAPTRVPGAEIPAAEIQLVELFRQNLMESIGLYQASLGQQSNETSGVAIQQRQLAGEYGSMEFIDNLTHSISTLGNIICEMLPKVYSNTKMRRLLLADDSQVDIVLNKQIPDRQTGTEHTINNIGLSRFSSHSIAGPSMTSQRSEVVHFLTEMSKANPQFLGVMPDLLVKYMDLPGGSVMERRLKHIVPQNMLTEDEKKDMPPPQPTPAEQAEMMKYESEMAKAQSNVQAEQLKVQQEQTQLEQFKVKLKEAQAKALESDMLAERENQKLAIEAASEGEESKVDDAQLENKIRAIVKRTLAEQSADQKMKRQTKTKAE